MSISRGENSIDQIVGFLRADLEFSPISSIVHWFLCALVAVNAYIVLFCGRRVGG